MSAMASVSDQGPRRRLFPGWLMAAAGFLSMMLMIGSTSYSFGALVKPLSAEFELSRGTVNLGLIIFQIVMGVTGPAIGFLFDRFSVRWMVLASALLFATGVLSIAFSHSLWLIVGGTVLTAVAAVGGGTLMASTLVSRWFRRRRGFVLGVTSTGAGMGGFVVQPYLAMLIDTLGWRTALLLQGSLVTVVLAALALIVIRDWPRDLATTPDGLPEQELADERLQADMRLWRFRDLAREPAFWLIAATVGLILGVEQAVVVTLIPFGTDIGYSIGQAASLVSVIAGTGLVGKLVFASIADRIDKRWAIVVVALLNMMLALMLLSKPAFPVALASSLVAGLGFGATLPIWGALVADKFGAASYGTAMGAMNPLTMVLQALIVLFSGYSFDITRSYNLAFLGFAGGVLVAAGLIMLTRIPPALAPPAATSA